MTDETSPKPVAARYAAAYSGAAEAYLRTLDPTLETVARRLVELAQARAESAVLDVATGTGSVARQAHARGARVTALDLAPGMIEIARAHSPDTIRFLVADATRMPLESGSFDAVTCGFGLSHMTDLRAVLAELRRVLRPGGLFVEAAWGMEGANPSFRSALDTLTTFASGRLHAFEGILDEDTWCEPRRGTSVLQDAGFERVQVSTERLEGSYPDAETAAAWAFAWPDYRETLLLLPEPIRERVRTCATEEIRRRGSLEWWFAINYYQARSPTR